VLCPLLWVTLLGQGVGLGDPQRAPQPRTFCDSVIHPSTFPCPSGRGDHAAAQGLLPPASRMKPLAL